MKLICDCLSTVQIRLSRERASYEDQSLLTCFRSVVVLLVQLLVSGDMRRSGSFRRTIARAIASVDCGKAAEGV